MELTTIKLEGLTFAARAGTTDESAIRRCVEQKCWFRPKRGFLPQPGEHWMELGANIGAFTCLAASYGARVTAYEPVPANAARLAANVAANKLGARVTIVNSAVTWDGITKPFFLPASERNHYRCSVFGKRGWRETQVDFESWQELPLDTVDGMKLDMEGAEIEILEQVTDWGRVRKLAFAYHFCTDARVARYEAIVGRLREHFTVFAPKVKGPVFNGFPDDRHVFCIRGDG